MGIDPYDWKQSIDGAGKYLRHLMDNYGFDLETAIYAYNAGPGTVQRYGVGATEENANYFPEIRERARQMMIRRYRYGDQEALRSPYVIRPEFIGVI
jgi:soluble lytic murein transglycosylase-like protein